MTVQKFVVAFAGNPNSGKSTIFNSLTGARQNVGNYPGVTVEKKEGNVHYKGYDITIVDLPGIYGLSAYSEDEAVARNFIINEKPDLVVHVLDASNLERNLYLTTQLIELEVPLVLAMNMSDIAEKKGQVINYELVSKFFGTPIIRTVGDKSIGTKDILEAAVKIYESKNKQKKVHIDYGIEVQEEIDRLQEIVKRDVVLIEKYPWRWLTIKLLEDDALVLGAVNKSFLSQQILSQKEKSRDHLKKHFSDSPQAVIADRRYGFINGVCAEVLKLPVEQEYDLSDKIDKIVLSRIFGIPIFALTMYLIFKFTFTLSQPIVGFFETFFQWLGQLALVYIPAGLLQSFVVNGLIGGVGSILGFFPLIMFMFFVIAFFEDSGYMARAAFIMDKVMSKFGLHGKSFLPLMIATNGCAVPGIMATRTLDSKRDRLITMMVIPFMICGAKLPIFALFIGAFFSAKHSANIMFLMYFLSVVIAFLSAWFFKRFVFKGEDAHFVMELPPYRVPSFKGLLLKMWERGWAYIKNAGTITLLLSIVIWAAFSFPRTTKLKEKNIEQSYAGKLGKIIEPLMKPIGLDGKSGIALIAGLAAKEVVVSTFGTMYALEKKDTKNPESLRKKIQSDPAWNPLKAIAFLIFCLIYLPCIAAIGVFYRESGSRIRWLLFLIFWTTSLAWGASFIVYQGGLLLNLGG